MTHQPHPFAPQRSKKATVTLLVIGGALLTAPIIGAIVMVSTLLSGMNDYFDELIQVDPTAQIELEADEVLTLLTHPDSVQNTSAAQCTATFEGGEIELSETSGLTLTLNNASYASFASAETSEAGTYEVACGESDARIVVGPEFSVWEVAGTGIIALVIGVVLGLTGLTLLVIGLVRIWRNRRDRRDAERLQHGYAQDQTGHAQQYPGGGQDWQQQGHDPSSHRRPPPPR